MCLVGFSQKQTLRGPLRKCSQEESRMHPPQGAREWPQLGCIVFVAVAGGRMSTGKCSPGSQELCENSELREAAGGHVRP